MPYPKNLLGKVATRGNLQAAWEEISRSAWSLSHGMSEQTIQDFRSNSKANLEIIRKELLTGSYRFGAVRAKTIKKKGGKKRPLMIADVRDRVVQRAMARILERRLENAFGLNNPASYAYLPKKGVKSAIKQMLRFHQDGCRLILEADIENFFGTVDINKLLGIVFSKLTDRTLDVLIEEAFKVEIGNKNDLLEEDWVLFPESSTGLPQGGYLSPLFSNVYLSKFDHKLLDAKFRLVRYADDFIIMCESIQEAEKAYDLSRQILEEELGLRLHPREDADPEARTRIIRVSQNPITFLGIQFNGARIWPASEKRVKLSNKLSELGKSRDVRTLLISMNNLVEGWIAAYAFSDINSSYAQEIDEEVNKCLWHALSKLGWKMKPKYLSPGQRLNSGIQPVNWYLNSIRDGLKDREVFAQYWSNLKS